eukprot:CAMPEP_0117447470 /NCGR_PEP_ID=MMETSP0759-20121206/6892_1 /TAXON_ID=63605 /ORGANISM="Percolomonas cosmopolitus, Strain WS" /LENGTH=372 /DNA_ID=CAMNT_0005239807 /DNA_START=169 /DNA_END=1287 /DNA_ORIENTATION=-
MNLKRKGMEFVELYQNEMGHIITKEAESVHHAKRKPNIPEKWNKHLENENDCQLTLTTDIVMHWITTRPSKHVQKKRKVILLFCWNIIKLVAPDATLNIYGSVASGLDDPDSDIDVGISLGDDESISSNELGDELLRSIADIFTLLKDAGTIRVVSTLRARVPIITVHELLSHLQIDLSLRSADLKLKIFKEYMRVDERVVPILKILKHWGKQRDICNAYAGYINSFGYACLGIAYLQTESPPILPNLQRSHADHIMSASEFEGFGRNNHMSIGELLHGFFEKMCHFDYENLSVSILHEPPYLPKEVDKLGDSNISDHSFVIVDPFEPSINFSRHVRKATLKVIKEEFARALECINKGHGLEILCAKKSRAV